ncbi:hypothetical protein HMPREF3069_05030 [Achromobacter xylosoxidans]|nr:hypothetical protein HMPREF3069_05030 [Achromobacter xylosoxidans]
MKTMPESFAKMQPTGLDARAFTPFPLAPHITKTIRFRQEFMLLVKNHASAMSVEEQRPVSQSEVIDLALTQFFATIKKSNDTQIDMFRDAEQVA